MIRNNPSPEIIAFSNTPNPSFTDNLEVAQHILNDYFMRLNDSASELVSSQSQSDGAAIRLRVNAESYTKGLETLLTAQQLLNQLTQAYKSAK